MVNSSAFARPRYLASSSVSGLANFTAPSTWPTLGSASANNGAAQKQRTSARQHPRAILFLVSFIVAPLFELLRLIIMQKRANGKEKTAFSFEFRVSIF